MRRTQHSNSKIPNPVQDASTESAKAKPAVRPDSEALPHEQLTWMVLAIAATAGFCIGALVRPGWTDNVESAQVVANIVRYPEHNPMGAYHSSAYSLVVQAAAVLLKMGLSDWSVSMIFSGVQAALSCSALALLALAFSRSAVVALLVPTILLKVAQTQPEWPTSYIAAFHGHNYPNLFPNNAAIYGVVGLFWLMLVLGLIALRKYKTGAFCLGLMPGLHVGLAIPCYFGVICASWTAWRSIRPALKQLAMWFSIGFAITILGGVWQFATVSHAAENVSANDVHAVMQSFLRIWDDHSRLLQKGEWLGFFETEYYILLLGIALLTFARHEILPQVKFAVLAILSITIASMAFTIALNIWPEMFDWRVRGLMITRWLNLNSFAFPTVALALLGYAAVYRRSSSALICLIAVVLLVWMGRVHAITAASAEAYGPLVTVSKTVLVRALIFPILVVLGALLMTPLSNSRWAAVYPKKIQLAVVLVMIGLFAQFFCWDCLRRIKTSRLSGADAQTQILQLAGQRPGLLLMGDSMWEIGRIQLRTRRPVLLDPTQFNMLLKVPQQGPRVAHILNRAYGKDFFKDPPPGTTLDERWGSFDPNRWEAIRREFGVTDVLVRRSFQLPLPLVAADPVLALYTFPPAEHDGQ